MHNDINNARGSNMHGGSSSNERMQRREFKGEERNFSKTEINTCPMLYLQKIKLLK